MVVEVWRVVETQSPHRRSGGGLHQPSMGVDRGGEENKEEEEEGGLGEGPEAPVGCAEEAVGDGEEHHGAPSVQPGEHQCTKAPGHQGHQTAGTLPLPVRLYHHL